MTILYFILAGVALGILVFVHELGHCIAAKKTGMVVEVFSIGFGRPVLKWRWKEVDWQLGWLPFGGYVRIKGMELTKKDKNTYVEPYDVPEGFFSKKPYKRIIVAVAGPFANFILAFVIFIALWGMGGREKPFSEFTQIIGWVDPQSELYALGVRPGDLITEYDGKTFSSSKDLLYAAMLGDKQVELKGYHINYATKEQTPFTYTIQTYPAPGALDDILTTGITAGGRYLIYDRLPGGKPNPLIEGSPMEGSGLQYGDQIVWADGELLFSKDQLNYLINQGDALLTVKRGETFVLTRQPRILAGDLLISATVKNELIDWQYEAGIKGKWQDLRVLPYNLSPNATVEEPLSFIDKDAKQEAFPQRPYNASLQQPLQTGDQIVAVDGVPVNTAYQLVDLLQTHHVLMMVQRDTSVMTKIPWKNEDAEFRHAIHWNALEALASTIGLPNGIREKNSYVLLAPVEPKRYDQFMLTPEASERIQKEFAEQKAMIEEIRDPEKRARGLQYLEKTRKELLLGVIFQDRKVDYNPNPFVLFGSVFSETYQTLKALILGYLHPKWISGPVGIVRVIHHGWTVGLGEALFWIAAISVNLGFLNLLPIPVLDGGYICLSLWEMLTRKRLKAKTMERLIIPFVVLLIALFVFLTFQDLSRLF